MTGIIDTHAHLNDPEFAGDLEAVVVRARQAGVVRMLVVGYDLPSSHRAVEIASAWEGIWAVVGVSPHAATSWQAEDLSQVLALAAHPKTVAIGEIGLDYHYDYPRETQQEVFRRQLALAVELDKPVVIHNREAHEDTLALLREGGAARVGGVLHCFSGSLETACAAIELGFGISCAGPLTFKNAARLAEVVRALPPSALLVETDAPYLTPHPYRGQRNEPALVVEVIKAMAALRGLSEADTAALVWENAARTFGLPGGSHADRL